jgi:two-component system, OmpR family, heavy metal sensor histidine kinase CusS
MRLLSLSSRLLAGLVSGTTVLLAITGMVIYVGTERTLAEKVDEALTETLKSNVSAITRAMHPRAKQRDALPTPFPEPAERRDFTFQCWDPGGAPALKSRHLEGSSLPRLARGFPTISYRGIEAGVLYFESIEMPDGTPGRAVALCFRPPPPEGQPEHSSPGLAERSPPAHPRFELVIARGTARTRETITALGWLLFLAWVGSSLGCAAIVAWVVRRGLRPLGRLREQLDELDIEVLDRQVELGDAPTELRPIVDELNGLLKRLRRSFERERSFNSDVAHELRTPLSGLRSTLEVFLDRPRDASESRETADCCLAITIEMQGVVEVLLEMAARSGGETNERRDPVRLADAITRCWAPHLDRAEVRGVSLRNSVPQELAVETDPALLRRILANLLENAILYGDENEAIEVSATTEEGWTHVAVTNLATGTPPAVVDRVFEAFWRADPARHDVGRHAGLGLPLCRKIASRLQARLVASLAEQRFTVTLSLPPAECS